MTRGPLYMIGNAHIDAVWLWQWQEGYQEVRATFGSALDRMEEYPDYVFSADSVAYFAWIAEHDPELFERIKARVAEGRFEVVGGWWVEPDCNVRGGESYVRHALYSQRWLAEHLGVIATVGCNVDPFGHNATLPQLLSKSRMDSYAFLRPQAHERELPAPLFWWESADGSRMLAYRIPHEYCSPIGEISGHVTKALQQLPVTSEPLMVFYGVGNHGGGPTIENIESIKKLSERDLLPQMFPSSARGFFDAVRDRPDIPVHDTDLQPHAIGCYSAHSEVKRLLRTAEQQLLAAEKWSTIAGTVSELPAATGELAHAWKQVLFNQFHDIAAGTAIAPAYDDARDQLGEARAIAAPAGEPVDPVDRAADRHPGRSADGADRGLQPAPLAGHHDRGVRVRLRLPAARRDRPHRRSGRPAAADAGDPVGGDVGRSTPAGVHRAPAAARPPAVHDAPGRARRHRLHVLPADRAARRFPCPEQ